MNTQEYDFGMMGTGYTITNFDPSNVQEDEIILMCVAMDISGSVQGFEKELNEAFSTFTEEMQKSHVAPRIMIKVLEFGEKVYEKSGYVPISQLDPRAMHFKPRDGSTALFAGAKKALESTVEYREQLEKTGINVKVLIFVITDGENNVSSTRASEVASILDNLAKEERNIMAFDTILFGVGNNASSFTKAQQDMHFKHLAVVGQSGKEIRKMIGFISASVSKSASNQTIAF